MKIFVEIGCCYFDTLHHLLDEGWVGYMIDPVGEYLDKIPQSIIQDSPIFPDMRFYFFLGSLHLHLK